ncbi:hypothetical protein INH39_25725 [Massilia violaceinigra]|uniref:Uncharacterized protein n=1 Tax=Massilia violaceinigra TaxID=2045208 RepID=A0ABY4A2D8_9BURK|nr:hypothetical protein [Massilia violaceinigra]UOD28812.1 hypothetical protein INH39_25725 [Massilia violaceinigra]
MKNHEKKIPLRLRSVYIRESKALMAQDFFPTIVGQNLVGEFRVNPGTVPPTIYDGVRPNEAPTTVLEFSPYFEFRYHRGVTPELISDESVCASISMQIALEYTLLEGKIPRLDDMDAWLEHEVLAQAWPYWQEFCHSTMLRMNLPVMRAPILDLMAEKI